MKVRSCIRMMLAVVAAASFTLAAPSASGQLVHIESAYNVNNPAIGFFTGTLEYIQGTSTFHVSLTNTSPIANGGYITAFAFNNPGNVITDVNLTTASGVNDLLGDTDTNGKFKDGIDFSSDVKGEPLGLFDI